MNFLPIFVALPMAVAFFIPLVSLRAKWFPEVSASLATFVLVLFSLQTIGRTGLYQMGNWAPPFGIVLVLDGLSCLLLVIINLISFMATLFSTEYLAKLYTSKLRYFPLFLLMVAGMNGMVLSGDLFNLFVFVEIAAIASFSLVGFGCQARELEAAFKYLVMSSVATGLILLGIACLYGRTGSLNLADIARILQETGFDALAGFAFVLLLAGFFIKAALVPFHAWLPDAHPSAPAPVSAMLSGVVIKACGIYAITRLVFNIFGFTALLGNLFVYIGILSMMMGVALALAQWDFKRLLAYHSISQMGYVIIGLGLGTPLGILGGLFHLFNHSIFKSLLFLDSGAVEYETGTRDLRKTGNLIKKMPVTSFSTLIASLSISGLPPFNGFWSKFIIILAAVQAGRPGVAVWLVLGSVLTLSSFSKVLKYAFFGSGEEFNRAVWEKYREVPALMQVPLVILAFLCIGTGLLALWGTAGVFGPVVDTLTGGVLPYIGKVLGR